MWRGFFARIPNDISNFDEYFVQQLDAVGIPRLWLTLKSYGTSSDSLAQVFRMNEKKVLNTLKTFCETIVKIFLKNIWARWRKTIESEFFKLTQIEDGLECLEEFIAWIENGIIVYMATKVHIVEKRGFQHYF